jgi:hypothetical protein
MDGLLAVARFDDPLRLNVRTPRAPGFGVLAALEAPEKVTTA